MYWKIPNGTTETIQGRYECWLPPVGYGCHSETGEIKKTDVLKRSKKKEDQFWERTPLPKDYKSKLAEEKKKQKNDPEYGDPSLDEFREQEWHRRLYGVWFYSNGVATYLTGEHYMYLNWWQLDDGYPQYRDPDRKRYYVLQLCIQDPLCAGMVEAANRRSGKSYRGGLFSYEYSSRTKDAHAGMQSKTSGDAKNLFKGKIATPFKRLPEFFRPEIDLSAGTGLKSEISFTKTARKGKGSDEDMDDLGLNSKIDYMSSEALAYDGWKLKRYLGDEVGKTLECDVAERWNVVKYCLRVGPKWVGKALLTTTVEKIGNEKSAQSKAFKKIWKDSDPAVRDENGFTLSGLYKFFTPAYEMYDFDQYGMPLIEQGKVFYMNTRNGLREDPRALASEIAKNPFTENELFYVDGDNCLYNSYKINQQIGNIDWRDLTERGTFSWKDGVRFGEVVWKKDRSGRFEIIKDMVVKNANQFRDVAGHYYPANTFAYRIGCDPFKYDSTKDQRRSDCAASVYKMHDIADPENPLNDAFVCRYVHRAKTTGMQYEDVLMMGWYFGCQILFESNVNNWVDYFREAKCWAYLMVLPGEKEPGLYSDGQKRTHQDIANYTEAYIETFIDKVYFVDKLKGWLEFDIGNTTAFDECMADGYALIAAAQKKYTRETAATRDVSDYFTQYSVA